MKLGASVYLHVPIEEQLPYLEKKSMNMVFKHSLHPFIFQKTMSVYMPSA